MEEQTLHILYTRHLKKIFQSMPIDFVNLVIGGILNLNGLMREHSNYYKRTDPPGPKLPRKEMNAGVIQEHLLPRREVLPIDLTIMKNFGSLFTQTSILICLPSYLFKLIQIQLPLLTSSIQIIIEGPDCPPSLMLKLDG